MAVFINRKNGHATRTYKIYYTVTHHVRNWPLGPDNQNIFFHFFEKYLRKNTNNWIKQSDSVLHPVAESLIIFVAASLVWIVYQNRILSWI